MADALNYEFMFDQALQRIKCVRDPHATKPETYDLKWNIVRQQSLFDFGGNDFEKYANVVDASKEISISCLQAIITQLFRQNNRPFDQINITLEKDQRSDVYYAIKDTQSDTLLVFKEIEDCSYWKIRDSEPDDIRSIMKQYGVSLCKYVYLMFDYAYLQIIGHNDDESDPGRGNNAYSIKWFFQTYFGNEECTRFLDSLTDYIQKVKDYLGYILVKSLTPNALINFRKVTENTILRFPYELLLHLDVKKFSLTEGEFTKLKTHFFDSKTFSILLGNRDFAESLITAEWLYDSMKKAHAIDLTTIGVCYFKAVEQLLFALVSLHKNEKRDIKKDNSRKHLPNLIPLNDENICSGAIDTSIGSMAHFYKDNLNMLRDDLDSQTTKQYIREAIFEYKDLRNGYSHKQNMHEWKKIEEIRDLTFLMVFLLLGAHQLSYADKIQLGIPAIAAFDDYHRLCEYVNYHSDELFFLNFGQNREDIYIACCEMHSKIIDNKQLLTH